jgi:hypothetical protein
MVEESTHEPKFEGSYPVAIGTIKLKNSGKGFLGH